MYDFLNKPYPRMSIPFENIDDIKNAILNGIPILHDEVSVEDYKKAISELYVTKCWNSIEEVGLPKEDGEYLVIVLGRVESYRYSCKDNFWSKSAKSYYPKDCDVQEFITHWSEMPKLD